MSLSNSGYHFENGTFVADPSYILGKASRILFIDSPGVPTGYLEINGISEPGGSPLGILEASALRGFNISNPCPGGNALGPYGTPLMVNP